MTDLKYGDKGPLVLKLQRLINRNPYWHHAPIEEDGEFGPQTAGAVRQEKYWMGYKGENIEPVAGNLFFAYLGGEMALKPDMLERRRKRQQAAKPTPSEKLQARILAYAKKDVGLIEAPNNRVKYNDWWPDGVIGDGDNDGGAYCVRAGSYWAAMAGFTGGRWENTDAFLEDAKRGRHGVHLTSDPYGGVGFVIDWSGHSDPDHYGVYVERLSPVRFRGIEANATLANGRQGVGYHERDVRNCWFIEREAA